MTEREIRTLRDKIGTDQREPNGGLDTKYE